VWIIFGDENMRLRRLIASIINLVVDFFLLILIVITILLIIFNPPSYVVDLVGVAIFIAILLIFEKYKRGT